MFIGAPTSSPHVMPVSIGRSGQPEPLVAAPTGNIVSTDVAPFLSPDINFDYQSGIAVFEIRNSRTGAVEMQYPSRKVVEEYIRHGASAQDSAKSAVPPAVDQDMATVARATIPAPAPESTTPLATTAPPAQVSTPTRG